MVEFWWAYLWPVVWIAIKVIAIIVPLLLGVAYLTYFERKVIAAMHLRRGPNVVGPYGLLQPIADGMKLFFKETIIPTGANRGVFILAPMMTFVLALVAWAVIPVGDGLVLADINVGILFLFAISSLGVYGILMAGWASNSKYAFLGSLRSAAQMVSYEVSMGFIIITVLLVSGSLNLSDIVRAQENSIWFVVPMFPMAVIFFISTLAETNRHPFDMPEA
ncbi:MAG: NADH-quinone oxidoreductase subunit H, partial [Rhodospirillaceae bacterium]|nr:NADH-quinone oxidoreductase subunit H [Rhodospirillaceae bacterium]